MSRDQKADYYQYLGDLFFIEQNTAAAFYNYEQSLLAKERKDLREKYARLSKSSVMPVPAVANIAMPLSPDEEKRYNKFRSAFLSKDYLAAVFDGVQLLTDYPGSSKAIEVSDQVIEIYTSVASSADKSVRLLKDKLFEPLKKLDSETLTKLAQNLFNRELFLEAMLFSQLAFDKASSRTASSILLSAGLSAYHHGEWKAAKEHFLQLEKRFSGTQAGREAVYRLGLLHMRLNEFTEAATYFEKYLVFVNDPDSEISARYWLWRTKQKLNIEAHQKAADELIKKYPLSYYGLRAQIELSQGKLKLPTDEKVDSWGLTWWLSDLEYGAWERFKVLISGGWYLEAQAELSQLPKPMSPEGQVVWAKLWAQTTNYHRAIDEVINIWQAYPTSYRSKEVLEFIYPLEFQDLIAKECEKYKLNPLLIKSLIRQESRFRINAQSSVGARGLMQLVRATATELAQDLRIKNFNADEDLFKPAINIQLGTYYVLRSMKRFDRNIPLALAAYNAGVGNIRAWLANRRDLDGMQAVISDAPESELWFDELPWAETTGYVKNVLRNWLIYRALDQSEIDIKFPIWTEMTN
jgi:soluble lytic murein transglycosylase